MVIYKKIDLGGSSYAKSTKATICKRYMNSVHLPLRHRMEVQYNPHFTYTLLEEILR